MPLKILTTTAFQRDLRRARRQGKDLDKLEAIVDILQAEAQLPARCRRHPLRGRWEGYWDCHVEPDWLLLYRTTQTALILVRVGTHNELFG